MTNQLTHHAALAHNEDLLRQATAARRVATLHQRPSIRDALRRLASRRRAAARSVISAPRLWPETTQRFGSSHRLPNGTWIHGAR
jgi:hypothetical protein